MHFLCNLLQPLIGCPEAASCHEACGKQVNIDQPDAASIQMMALYEEKDFVVVSFLNIWKHMKEGSKISTFGPYLRLSTASPSILIQLRKLEGEAEAIRCLS